MSRRPPLAWRAPRPGLARLGVLVLPEHCGRDSLPIWRQVDEAGFAHAWTFDHLTWRGLPGEPWFDALTTLAAAAVVTSRVTIGPLVATPNFRHPVLLARQAMTLDHLSTGRFVLGLGAGAAGADSRVLGGGELPAADRGGRFAEFVELTDRLLSQRQTTFRGRYFEAADAQMVPGCLQQPRLPLAIAAPRRLGMRLAARHGDLWVCNGPAEDTGELTEQQAFTEVGQQLELFEQACGHEGRDFAALPKLVYLSRLMPRVCESPDRILDVVGRCAAMGWTDVVLAWPRPAGPLTGNLDALLEVAAERPRVQVAAELASGAKFS